MEDLSCIRGLDVLFFDVPSVAVADNEFDCCDVSFSVNKFTSVDWVSALIVASEVCAISLVDCVALCKGGKFSDVSCAVVVFSLVDAVALGVDV